MARITLYGLRNCDRSRAVSKALRAAGHEVALADVAAGLESAFIDRLLAQFGDAVLNRRSTTWRRLSAEERAMPAAALLATHPKLMRRPVLALDDGRLLPGWQEEAVAPLLAG